MSIELKPIAESKVRQLGGDVCGVLVRKDEKLAAVDEHGRTTWLGDESLFDSIKQRADAWLGLVELLNDLTPEWRKHPGTGRESAFAAIRGLAQAARTQGGQGAEPVHQFQPDSMDGRWIDCNERDLRIYQQDGHWPTRTLYTQPQPAVPEWLLEMSRQMREQPNRMTAHPFWQVRCKRYLPTMEGYSEHHRELCGDEGVIYRSIDPVGDLHEYLLEEHEDWCKQWAEANHPGENYVAAVESWFDPDDGEWPEGLAWLPVQEIEEVVTTHFTQADAEWFIKRKQHDYPALYTYVESAYWSPQLRQLQDWIISLATTPQADERVHAKCEGRVIGRMRDGDSVSCEKCGRTGHVLIDDGGIDIDWTPAGQEGSGDE